MERLESFGLPDTFPAYLMPAAGAQFVRDCVKGIGRTDITRMARDRGFMPSWKRLTHLGPGVYGLSLTIDRMGVPLMVRMSESGEAQKAVIQPSQQQSLF
ncbi:hypothetical protein EVC45_29905 [Paraburkholderia sp. UYCP14C]|uniref:hypothetical protein n=1 Tax=Paraburkholderia sp. UYCP14C TaxID=2511130 RepID=UPI001021DC8A|nr:hypothetical protein [Paraburkholderia sp. UYCP14C]RZF26068.1 hypothetical protein EVC45_29905 [Paraburkholderia sp. UYCP14C]